MSTDTTEETTITTTSLGPRAERARARLRAALAGDDTAEHADETTAEASTEDGGEGEEKEQRRARRLRRVRMPRSNRLRAVLVVVLVVLLAGTGGFFWLKAGKSILGLQSGEGVLSFLPTWLPENVAFQYGDRDVSVDELNSELDTLRALYGVQVPTDGNQLAAFRKDAAKAYAVSLILDRAAADNGIVIADKTARDTMSRFVQEKLGNGADAYSKFVAALGDQGTTEQAVIDELKRRLAMAQLFDKITAGLPAVTDQDVQAAFAQRKNSLGTPEKRQIANIVVASKDDADRALAAIRSGTPFATEAQRVSLDGSTRDKGGDLGAVSRDQLEQAYGDVAFAATPGQPFGPVQNRYGWNIGQVGQVTPPVPADLAQVKEPLRQELTVERALEKWRSWLGDQIKNAHVRYADEYRPADPDAAPGDVPTQAGIPQEGGGK